MEGLPSILSTRAKPLLLHSKGLSDLRLCLSLGGVTVHVSVTGTRRVLQPGNPGLSGAVPLGTPYPVLRYNGATGYSMCSQFPCTREHLTPLPSLLSAALDTSSHVNEDVLDSATATPNKRVSCSYVLARCRVAYVLLATSDYSHLISTGAEKAPGPRQHFH